MIELAKTRQIADYFVVNPKTLILSMIIYENVIEAIICECYYCSMGKTAKKRKIYLLLFTKFKDRYSYNDLYDIVVIRKLWYEDI